MTFGIVGYSTRALVQAVRDLGHRACAIDAFGDQDTLELADTVEVVDDWPAGIMRAARRLNVDAWLLAGGVENLVGIIGDNNEYHSSRSSFRSNDCLADLAPVLGADEAMMATLRSPSFWESLCRDGIHWPTTRVDPPDHEMHQWLIKSQRGAGGLNVRAASISDRMRETCGPDPTQSIHNHIDGSNYWQKRVVGRVIGVTWLLHGPNSRVLGVTGAWNERDWPAPTEFLYRGSIGPLTLDRSQLMSLEQLGQRVLTALPNYRGYLQADLIEEADGRLWLIEFNPRWTSGMEILHEASLEWQRTPLAEHLGAWGIQPVDVPWQKPRTKLVSKAIYYCADQVELSQEARCRLQSLRNWQMSTRPGWQWCVADVPAVTPTAPMRFDIGSPILTLKCRHLDVLAEHALTDDSVTKDCVTEDPLTENWLSSDSSR